LFNEILQAIQGAFALITSLDKETYEIIGLTIVVTVLSTGIAAVLGLPFGMLISSRNFFGKKFIESIITTSMGLPPVVVGLVVYLFLSRNGPIGSLRLLFTTTAMVIAQVIIVFPIISGLTMASVKLKYKPVKETCKGLGIGRLKTMLLLAYECRYPLVSALLAGYGRAMSEVGAVNLVGGNIEHSTRLMTTAIMLETSQGDFSGALALGIILLFISFVVNWASHKMQRET
jgi:tungstate transport system permease protein